MSTANANHPHQRWTRQLLCASTLLSRPSASGASLRLAFGDALCLASTPHRGSHALSEGSHPAYKPPPLRFVLRLRLQKVGGGGGGGGVFAGHYTVYISIIQNDFLLCLPAALCSNIGKSKLTLGKLSELIFNFLHARTSYLCVYSFH